jgi:hypothetical protein
MSGTVISLIISLISGAAGGNIVGTLLKQFNLGPLGNSLAGIIGGGLGGQLLAMLAGGGAAATGAAASPDMAGGLDIGTIVSQIVGGGVGGGVLMVIVGFIRQMMGGQGK